MTRITVDLGALRTLLTNSLPFAGDDNALPVINSVLLEGKGKWLTATATDRYVVGMSRTAVEGTEGFAALVKLADVRHILRTFTAAKGQGRGVVVSLTVKERTGADLGKLTIDKEDGLFADCDTLTATYNLVDGMFPKVHGIFRGWNPSTKRSHSGYNPSYLAKFQHVTDSRGEPIRLSIGDGTGITIIQAGGSFLGAVMPVRLADDSPAKDLEAWADVIGEAPKPEAEPAPEPAPVPAKKAVAKKAPARKRAAAKVAA